MSEGKNKGGRPTDYTPDMLELAEAYITSYAEYGHAMPSVVGLCQVINRSTATVYRWRDEEGKEQFKDTLASLLENQQLVLLNNGLTNTFNAAITKLALGNHGFHEKVDTQHTGNVKIETKGLEDFYAEDGKS